MKATLRYDNAEYDYFMACICFFGAYLDRLIETSTKNKQTSHKHRVNWLDVNYHVFLVRNIFLTLFTFCQKRLTSMLSTQLDKTKLFVYLMLGEHVSYSAYLLVVCHQWQLLCGSLIMLCMWKSLNFCKHFIHTS